MYLRADEEERTSQSLMAVLDAMYPPEFQGSTAIVDFETRDDTYDDIAVRAKSASSRG
jgi:hypothetical protein